MVSCLMPSETSEALTSEKNYGGFTMNIEKKRIEMWSKGKGTIGHITLDNLAHPETVKVTLLGEEIIPESFDCYGHPNFTEEQAMLFMFKEEELRRKKGEEAQLKAEISYDKSLVGIPKNFFDTIEGIERSISSISDLNEMLKNRSRYIKAYKDEQLHEFILFGCFMLDRFGQVMSIEKSQKGNVASKGEVEYLPTFRRNNQRVGLIFTTGGYAIPTAGSVCPCCGKTFTIDDIKNNPCVYIDGKFYHDSCWRNYRKLTEIDKFTRQLVGLLYEDADYQFELLPNGYCHEDCCSHIPWFLFHTIDGDIIMGWRKRVISIEWQENYKPFDMKELFGTEDVTKWEKDGKRGIHAWGQEKAFEYLRNVLKNVNPTYLKW